MKALNVYIDEKLIINKETSKNYKRDTNANRVQNLIWMWLDDHNFFDGKQDDYKTEITEENNVILYYPKKGILNYYINHDKKTPKSIQIDFKKHLGNLLAGYPIISKYGPSILFMVED